MKRTTLQKYFLAYVGLAGLAVTIEANATIVTPGNPGVWNYETSGYTSGANPPTTLPIVSNPAAPGTGGSVKFLTDAGGPNNAAGYLSTAAYDGQSLSSINSLGYTEKTVQNNGQATPYLTIYVALNNGSGNFDKLYFEPTYQTAAPVATPLNTWQTWTINSTSLLYDANGVLGTGGYGPGYVNTLATFLNLYPNAKIADNPSVAGDGGISITDGWNGYVNEAYVNDVVINGTTYDFEPGSLTAVPESSTIIAGVLLLLPFGATMLRKKKVA